MLIVRMGNFFCVYSERGKVFCNSLHVAPRKSFTPNIRQVSLQQSGILFIFPFVFLKLTLNKLKVLGQYRSREVFMGGEDSGISLFHVM